MSAAKLVVACAGGFGREVAFAAATMAHRHQFVGFLDDQRTGLTPEGWPVVGTLAQLPSDHEVVVAIGSPRIRRELVARLAGGGARFATVDAVGNRHASVQIGEGSMLLPGALTTVSASIGRHFIAYTHASIAHDATIGDFVTVAPLVAISGSVRIGDGVEIGAGASVRQGISLGIGCMIGMGAVVVKDVEPNTVVVGNPARPISTLEPW